MAYPLFMMTNRNRDGEGLGQQVAAMKYFEHKSGSAVKLAAWQELSKAEFIKRLQQLASTFPIVDDAHNEEQQHVNVFVHGYNNDWQDAMRRYEQIRADLFEKKKLGLTILFTWPSNGSAAGYLPDREDARKSAPAFAQELVDLQKHLLKMQDLAASSADPQQGCRAKISVIAHSMGNYVTQKALTIAARQLNSPQLITLVTQLAMVAADVDNDLFQDDKPLEDDGSLMSNLCYRIGALYTGLDQVLGASAGLKHFGTRRLGRSGLADVDHVWDNVFHFDVSDFIDKRKDIHSGVFLTEKSLGLLEKVLRGVDRRHF